MGENDRVRDGTGAELHGGADDHEAPTGDWLPALWADHRAVVRPADAAPGADRSGPGPDWDERGPGWDERGSEQRGSEQRGSEQRGSEQRGSEQRGPQERSPGWLAALWTGQDPDHERHAASVEQAPEPEPEAGTALVPVTHPHHADTAPPSQASQPSPGEDPAADAARRRRLAAWSAVARARHDLADAEAVLARDTGEDRARWEADAVVAEEIHTALVAAREEARHHRRRRPDLVGLELAERLALDRLGCDDYEDLLVAWAERELAERGPVATGRDERDVIALDDLAAVELARAELQEAVAAWYALDEEDASRT